MEHQLLLPYAYKLQDEGQVGAALQAGHTSEVAIHREDCPPGCFLAGKKVVGRSACPWLPRYPTFRTASIPTR